MDIIFQAHPDVVIGGNTFRNVNTILQYEETPLLEVTKTELAGYTTRFAVYHPDGTKLAVVKGSRIHLTEEGKKAQINQRFEARKTVCEVEGRPILELRRDSAAALSGWAELYAPEGVLIRAHDSGVAGLLRGGGQLQVAGATFGGMLLDGFAIGIHVSKNGDIAIGGGPRPT